MRVGWVKGVSSVSSAFPRVQGCVECVKGVSNMSNLGQESQVIVECVSNV